MILERAEIPDVVIVRSRVHGDHRGFFTETWRADVFARFGIAAAFVQDNHSRSQRGTLRGLHYQIRNAQGQLVRAVSGSVFDVAVDLRRSSPTFGRWFGMTLAADDHCAVWVPAGFAHGFYVLSESADLLYKCTDYYAREHERTLLWSDPAVGIRWPLTDGIAPILSAKDEAGRLLSEAECYE